MPARLSISFDNALKDTAKAVDGLIGQLLPANRDNRLVTAMRYAALAQGKRLRPFFVVAGAGLFGVAEAQALRVGAALELLHCYSLVHDDLPAMDNDMLRRGRPTLHVAFDEATAILAGDSLQTLAFAVLADPATHDDAGVRCALVAELAAASGHAGMAGGQMRDIEAETRNFSSVAEIAAMQSMKTGALFRFACEAGAIMAGADRAPLRQYADHIGLAFQIADDILDVESDAATLGKATQKDQERGKATFVDLMGLDGARTEAQRLADAAIAALAVYGDRAELLRAAARFMISRRK